MRRWLQFILLLLTPALAFAYASEPKVFSITDGSGSITAFIDNKQNIVARYEYDPFGQRIGKWGTLADANRYRFSSKEYDPNSGLYCYGFRFYAPNLQRWLNRDPINEQGGLNLYRFARNNPLRNVDFFGLQDNGFCLDPKTEDETPEEAYEDEIKNGLDYNTPETQAEDEAIAQAAADQAAQQAAQEAREKAAEAVKLPDNQGSEGDNALPKTAKSPKPCPSAPRATPGGGRGPNFIVSKGGTVFPVPEGAAGPGPVNSGNGFSFTGGSGGNGLRTCT